MTTVRIYVSGGTMSKRLVGLVGMLAFSATVTACTRDGERDGAEYDSGKTERATQRSPTHDSSNAVALGVLPTLPGQDAYGAIAEITRMLEADSTTDWTATDLEGLRQHLIDMNAVTLGSIVEQRDVPAGVRMGVTGIGRTRDALRRMVSSHAEALSADGRFRAASEPIANGVRFTVTARQAGDETLIARIRGLGFIGLMATGEHHAMHHLAIAKGNSVAGHDARHDRTH